MTWICAVPALDDRRIMKRPLPGLARLEVPGPFPGFPFIVGERDGQRMPAPGGVVVDQGPVPGAPAARPRCPPRGWGTRCRPPAPRSSPSSADVLWRIRWCGPLSRMKATSVPSFFRTRLGWMLPKPIIGLPVVQVFPSIVAERHDRGRERVASRAAGSTGTGAFLRDWRAGRSGERAASSPAAGRAGRATAP